MFAGYTHRHECNIAVVSMNHFSLLALVGPDTSGQYLHGEVGGGCVSACVRWCVGGGPVLSRVSACVIENVRCGTGERGGVVVIHVTDTAIDSGTLRSSVKHLNIAHG